MNASPPYLLLKLDPPPKIILPGHHRSQDYRFEYSAGSPLIVEINFLQEGSISEMQGSTEVTYPQGSVYTFVDNRKCTRYCKDPWYHEVFLRFFAAEPPEPMGEKAVAGWFSTVHQAILPANVRDPAICERIGALIRSIAGIYDSNYVARGLKKRSALYEILSLLTEAAVTQARLNLQLPEKSRNRATNRAVDYIHQHLSETIRVRDIAEAADISYDHLKRIFHSDMNMSLLEYINRARIQEVGQLIVTRGTSLEEAGAAVGIGDRKHLCQLFRRYTGMSVREYRQIYGRRPINKDAAAD